SGRASVSVATGPSTNPATLRIGPAGFSYPDWVGPVFSPSQARGEVALAALSRWLDLVEINASHYRVPVPAVATTWLRATAATPGFHFTAKLHRGYTHGDPTPTTEEHRAMRAFLEALAADGRLDAVLAQFPPSFRFGDRTLAYVRRLATHFEGFRLAAEF